MAYLLVWNYNPYRMSDANQEPPSSETSESINSCVLVKITPSQDDESDKTASTSISPDGPYTSEAKPARNGSLPEGILYRSSLNVILPNFIEHEQRASSPFPEASRQRQPRTAHSSPVQARRRFSQDTLGFITGNKSVEESNKVR